ncbi:MAG: phosphatase PAP2 family protein [Allosphingosinicella sp.]
MRRLPAPAFAASIAALAALLLAMLAGGGPGSAADLRLLQAAQIDPLETAAWWLTWLGGFQLLVPATLAAAAWAAWRRRQRDALLILAIGFGARLLVELQKLGFDRMRPDPAGHGIAVHSMAFPSGHAANAMAVWLGIALLAAPPRLRTPAVLAALALTAVVGLSRLVLGVHWPSDVVGGWAFGAAWTLLLLRLFSPKPR